MSDPRYFGTSPWQIKKILSLSHRLKRPDLVCLRNKKSKNLKREAKAFLSQAKKLKIQKTILNSNITLAKRLHYFGVHLPASKIDYIKEAKRAKLFVIVSTHNEEEMKRAQRAGADMITYSPIFPTPNKGVPKGVKSLRKIVCKSKIPVIALGGIVTKRHIHKIKAARAAGFASIRYFVSPL
nr:thiamine phosphate synthase [Nitratiruptor sp. YY09-18]